MCILSSVGISIGAANMSPMSLNSDAQPHTPTAVATIFSSPTPSSAMQSSPEAWTPGGVSMLGQAREVDETEGQSLLGRRPRGIEEDPRELDEEHIVTARRRIFTGSSLRVNADNLGNAPVQLPPTNLFRIVRPHIIEDRFATPPRQQGRPLPDQFVMDRVGGLIAASFVTPE